MIEAAADAGVEIAEVHCILRGWGGREQDYDEAFKRYKSWQRADGEHQAIAMCLLGSCHVAGPGVAKDETKAFEWYNKAAERGDSVTPCKLGCCHYMGLGVARDYGKAAAWFAKAAESHNEAVYNLN